MSNDMNESSQVKPQWSVREYREGDEEHIRELRAIALSGPRDAQWWQWQYRKGPAGPTLIWLAEAERQIIGHHALIPLNIKVGDRTRKGCFGFDVMTHPDYQRLGVLSAIRTKIYESAAANGIDFSYGTATPQIFPIYKKRQSVYIAEPLSLIKIVAWGDVLKERFKIPAFIGNCLGYVWERLTGRRVSIRDTGIEVEQISSFDKDIDEFWQKARVIKPIMVVRDMKYLNWRYVEKPWNEYRIFLAKKIGEIAGYIVIKLEDNGLSRGYIIDLLTLPREDAVAEALIARAVGYFKEAEAVTISCLMMRDTPYYRILKKMGFLHRHSGLFIGVRMIDESLSVEFLTNPDNWYFGWGDTDNR